MSIVKSVVKNTFWLYSAEIVSTISSTILIILISRLLGSVELGMYSFIFSYLTLFSLLSSLGLPSYFIREIARDKSLAKLYYRNVGTLRMLLCLFSLALSFVLFIFFEKSRTPVLLFMLALPAVFFNFQGRMIRHLFQAHELMEYEAIARIIQKLIDLFAGGYVLLSGKGLFALFIVLIISNLVYFLVLFISSAYKIILFKFDFNFKLWGTLIKKSLPFWFAQIFLYIYFRTDIVMLKFLKGYHDVGLYEAAYKLIAGLNFIPLLFVVSLYPVMSKLFIENKKLLLSLFKKGFYYLSIVAIPLGIGTFLVSEKIILFLYGNEFLPSSLALKILVLSEIFVFVSHLMGYLLNSINLQKIFSISTFVCAVLNILLNILLIPRFGFIGAAFATLLTQGFNFGLLFTFCSKKGFKLNLPKLLWKPLISAGAMSLFIISFFKMNFVLLIIFSVFIYLIFLYLIGGVSQKDISKIKEILKIKKT